MRKLLKKGQRYQGKISFSSFGKALIGTNGLIAMGLKDEGFDQVTVTGTGLHRVATGIWNKPDQEREVNYPELKELIEI